MVMNSETLLTHNRHIESYVEWNKIPSKQYVLRLRASYLIKLFNHRDFIAERRPKGEINEAGFYCVHPPICACMIHMKNRLAKRVSRIG